MASNSDGESEHSQASVSSPSQKFIPQEDDEETLWEVIEITGEKVNTYKVRWKGNDPKTMKPWPQSWVAKTDCTDDLVKEWKRKIKDRKKSLTKGGRASTASKKMERASIAANHEQPTASASKSTRRSTSTATAKPPPKRLRSSIATPRTTTTATPTTHRSAQNHDRDPTDDEDKPTEEIHKSKPRPSGFSKPKGKKRKLDEATSAHNSAKNISGGDPVHESEPTKGASARPRKKRKVVVEVVKQELESEDSGQSLTQPQQDLRKGPGRGIVPEDDEEEDERMVEGVLSEVGSSPHPDDNSLPHTATMTFEPPLHLPAEESMSLHQSLPAIAPRLSPVQLGLQKNVARDETPDELTYPPDAESDHAHQRLPTEERSVFWDGGVEEGADPVHVPILSPGAIQRLERFDEEVMGIPRKRRKSRAQSVENSANIPTSVQLSIPTAEPFFRPNPASALMRASPSANKSTPPPESEANLTIKTTAMNTKPDNALATEAQTTSSGITTTKLPNDPLPRRSANPPTNSYTNDVVPETDESQSQSQELQIPVQPLPTANPKQISEQPERGTSKQKTLRPIPQLSPSTFHPHLPTSSLPESITNVSDESNRPRISQDDDPEAPMSSIEQFDSPEKPPPKPVAVVRVADPKNKGKAKESATDIWESEVVQRGQAIAEAAKRKRESRSKSPSSRPPKKTVDDIITRAKTRSRSGSSLSYVGSERAMQVQLPPSIEEEEEEEEELASEDVAGASTAVVPPSSAQPADQHPHPENVMLSQMENAYVDLSGGTDETQPDIVDDPPHRLDPILLRQEEEESTQDMMMDFEHGRLPPPPQKPVPVPERGVRPQDILPTIDEGESSDPNARGEMSADGGEDSDTSLKIPRIVVQQPSRATSIQSYSAEEDRQPAGRMTRSRSRSQTPAVPSAPNGKDKKVRPWNKRRQLEEDLETERAAKAELQREMDVLRQQMEDLQKKMQIEKQNLTDATALISIGLEKQTAEKVELINKLAAAEKAKVDAEKDRDFFREQYAQASGYVSQVRDENKDLEKRIKIAEQQTQDGVNLVKMTFETRLKTLDDDLKSWRKMANFLIEKDQRSNNEEICRRAAEEPELRALCVRLTAALADAQERIGELEADLDEKVHACVKSDYELDQYKQQAIQLHVDLNEALTKLDRVGRGGDYEDESVDASGNGHEFVYCCKWRLADRNESCREVFSTVAELEHHLRSSEGHLATLLS